MSIPVEGWAKHYCVGKPRPRRTDGLSWMDPLYPKIDPVTLEIDDPSPNRIQQPQPPQLDDLYVSEKIQIHKLYGLRTWEAAVLASVDAYTAQDEAQWLAGDAIDVKESDWFPFWSKDCWVIDFTVPPNWSNGWSTSHHWSAHDPAVWEVLRKAIQLAENILRCSLQTHWFQSLLNPANVESVLVELPLGSGKFRNIWRMRTTPVPWLTPEKTVERLQDLLDRKLYWSFNDKSTQSSYEPGGYTQGLTVPVVVPKGDGPIAIFVDILNLRTAMDPMTTDASREATLVNLADTLLHELMHAIGQCHRQNEVVVSYYGLPYRGLELFGPGEGHAELGHSWEKATWGGTMNPVSTGETPEYFHTTTGSSLVMGLVNFPLYWESYERSYGFSWNHRNGAWQRWPIPALWHRSLASQAFWDRIVAKFGPGCLKVPKMLTSVTYMGTNGFPTPYSSPRDTSGRWEKDFAPMQFHEKSLKSLARQLQQRRQKYRELRPWFVDTFSMWQMTPWNARKYREELAWLKDIVFCRKNDRHEADAQRVVDHWIRPFEIAVDQTGIIFSQAPIIYDDVKTQAGITLWFWRALGYLLYASLPGRRPKTTPVKKPERSLPKPWAVASGLPMTAACRDGALWCIATAEDRMWKYPEIDLQRRHTEEELPSTIRKMRLGALSLAMSAFEEFEMLCIHPAGLGDAFENACQSLEAQIEADRDKDYMSWLDFDFDMPPYPNRTVEGQAMGIMEFWAAGSLWKQPDGMGLRDPAGQVLYGEDPTTCLQMSELPLFALTSLAGAPLRAGERPRRHQIPYFTIAELYDYAQKLGEPLVLVEDGFDLDVYRRSGVCRSLGVAQDELVTLTKQTFYGRQLIRAATEKLHDADHPSLAIARVVRVLRQEDIALGDGKGGRPLWIKMRRNVFDITHLECVSEPRLTELLASTPGGDPSQKLRDEGYNLLEIRKSLAAWRVGIVARKPAEIAGRHSIRTFTSRSLRRHEFREMGMYVGIDKRVYDITNYVDLHPGGLQVLVENAGRDITALFNQHHQGNRELILSKLQELYVGKLVEQRQEYQEGEFQGLAKKGLVLPHEIRLNQNIYSVQALQDSDEYDKYAGLVEKLVPYLGTDATQHMTEEGNETPLLQFARLKGYVIANVERTGKSLSEIDHGELNMFDGQVDEIKELQNDSFVASDEMVYDLTAAMQFGSANPNYAKLRPFLGGIVTDAELKTYLRDHCNDLICAILVSRKRLGGGGGCAFKWDPTRQAPPHYKMPIWTSRPKKKKKPPSENEISPYPNTVRQAQEGLRDEDFEKKDIFRPSPSGKHLSNLMANLKYPHRAEFGGKVCKKTIESYNASRPLSSIPKSTERQRGRFNSEFRRRKAEKRVKEKKVSSMDAISSDPVRGLDVFRPKVQSMGKRKDHLEAEESVKESTPARGAEAPSIEARRALDHILKRKLRFKGDDRPTKKQR